MKNIMIGMLVLIFLAPVILSISIDIDIKESFVLNEEISFTYTIISEEAQEIEYIAAVNCPNAPLPLLEIKTASLEANIPFTETYIYISTISEDIEPQTCEAGIGILIPEEILESKSFEIITNPSFEFNILTCKDSSCVEKIKVFILNEDIYLDYTSEISDANVIATITYPDDSTNQFGLPTSIKAEQTGTYELETSASKQGYKTIIKKIQFGVIGQAADISYTEVQDVGAKKESKISWYLFYFFIVAIVFLIVAVFIKLFKKIKRKKRFGEVKGLEKNLKKGLKKKEKIIKKKERKLLQELFRRKKKLPLGKKQELNKKIEQEKKVFTREKVEMRKEFSKRLRKEGKMLKKKEKKIIGEEKIEEIRRLLAKGRMQLASRNNLSAKNTYRKIRRLHVSLKPGEKNREVYNQLLRFHERLNERK